MIEKDLCMRLLSCGSELRICDASGRRQGMKDQNQTNVKCWKYEWSIKNK